MKLLNKETINNLPEAFLIPNESESPDVENAIVHIGVGGFHRAHQAYALAKLIKKDSAQYTKWRITGVGLMPQDKDLIANLKNQDHLYTLRMVNAANEEKLMLIDSIKEFLHLDTDLELILNKISNSKSKVISLTITEGGYNYDFEKDSFKIDNVDIVHDLTHKSQPKTVFGLLALGLKSRKSTSNSPIVLLSCDNIIGNGEVLEKSLLSFLKAYDIDLYDWVKAKVSFPNCMVDRITPVPQKEDVQDLQERFGVVDNCLVVSEDYFQWVIEKGDYQQDFPPLELVGVEFVDKVLHYEHMKLGILNGGHTLVGLLGDALGYTTIHDSVTDPLIDSIYNQYILEEVVPVLVPLAGTDYGQYFELVKKRFSNAMINDSTDRIISFTSDKFPKFILPIIQKQLTQDEIQVEYTGIIVAAWWCYLHKHKIQNNMATVVDSLKNEWIKIFEDEDKSIDLFVAFEPVFGEIAKNRLFKDSYLRAIRAFRDGEISTNLNQLIKTN